jgi:hypothetical protein
MLQRELLQDLTRRAVAVRERIAAAVRPLDGDRLMRRPPAGGWSAGEVLEHLCVSDAVYEAPLDRALRGSRPDAAAPLREFRPTWAGKFLATSLASPRKLPSPKSMKPGPTPRGGVLEDFLARARAFEALMESATSQDWRAVKLASPALPALPLMPKFNLGDVFIVQVVHMERHAAQIERVIAATR